MEIKYKLSQGGVNYQLRRGRDHRETQRVEIPAEYLVGLEELFEVDHNLIYSEIKNYLNGLYYTPFSEKNRVNIEMFPQFNRPFGEEELKEFFLRQKELKKGFIASKLLEGKGTLTEEEVGHSFSGKEGEECLKIILEEANGKKYKFSLKEKEKYCYG